MKEITIQEYNAISSYYRSIWDTERYDWKNWETERLKYMGKRTMMVYDNGTALLVEGIGFIITGE